MGQAQTPHVNALTSFVSSYQIHRPLMSNQFFRIAPLACLLVACTQPAPVTAPAPATNQRPVQSPAPTGALATPQDTTARAPVTPGAPRPYNRVITADAKSRRCLFAVHRIGDRLYFEIPAHELNKDMLIEGRYARASAAPPSVLMP